MQNQSDKTGPEAGLFSRFPKPSPRQRRLAAMGTAAAIVVIGLGAFALLPPVRAISDCGRTHNGCRQRHRNRSARAAHVGK